MSQAVSQLKPAYIQAARIIDVDPVRFTCTLRTEVGERDARDVPIPSVYTHPFEGEGIHHMPEIGAHVWALWPSEGDTRARIINYRGLSNEGSSHKANRPGMVPGDMMMISRDRNGIKVRRGGVVEVLSTPLARTFYLPINNEVLTYAENWNVETLGGSIRFNTSRREEDPDLQKGSKLTFSVKEFVDHPHPAGTLQMGGQIVQDPEELVAFEEERDQVVDLRVWQDSTIDTFLLGPLRPSVALAINRTGNVGLTTYRPALNTPSEVVFPSVDMQVSGDGGLVVTSYQEAGIPGVTVTLDQGADAFDLDIAQVLPELSAIKVTGNRTSELKVALAPLKGGHFSVFETEINTEGVVLGVEFLTDLRASLLEIQAALNGLGLPTPDTLNILTKISTSLDDPLAPKGKGPFLSTRMRTE